MTKCLITVFFITSIIFGTQNAYSQTSNDALKRVGEKQPGVKQDVVPFNCLTVLIGDEKTRHCYAGIGREAGSIVCHLLADGTFSERVFRPVPPESLIESIKFHGETRGECLLKVFVVSERVDFEIVAKAIQSLGGIEKRFKSFRIETILTNPETPGVRAEQFSGKPSNNSEGAETGIAPRSLAKGEDEMN